ASVTRSSVTDGWMRMEVVSLQNEGAAPRGGAAGLFRCTGTVGAARASAGPKAGRRGKSNRSERDFAGEITTGGRRPGIVAAARLVGAAGVPAAVEESQRAGVGGEVDLGAVAVVPLV